MVAAKVCSNAFIAWPESDLNVFERELPRLRDVLTSLHHVAASWLYCGNDTARIERLDRLARKHGCTILATNDVHYHAADRRPLTLGADTTRFYLPVAVASPAILAAVLVVRKQLGRIEGAALTGLYAAYVAVAIAISS